MLKMIKIRKGIMKTMLMSRLKASGDDTDNC